jgi:ATP-dependent Lhr-like helicase
LAGEHVLLAAPTGNGKTLAAYLPIWDQSLNEDDAAGVRCLHISPLRALCNDLYERLQNDLLQLKNWVGTAAWKLRVGLYTGDRKSAEKRQLINHPPQLMITTPESLALLLAHPQAEHLLGSVRWVIVDEVHALASNKRGADLAISLERLADLSKTEPQRIGLSATCAPLQEIAHWLGGTHRSVTTLGVPDQQRWKLDIHDLSEAAQEGEFLSQLLDKLQELMRAYRTILVFTNVRSLSERIAWTLRRRLPALSNQIAVHHGSLAKSARQLVEQQLQRGELRVVLSSTSLELGIDIGFIDHIAFVHAPGGAARLLQRLGRAGHHPGGQRAGTLIVTSKLELLEAVATRAAGQDGFLEPLEIPNKPLDVLCQQLVALGVSGHCPVNKAWHLIRQAYQYRNLSLAEFCQCLEYLTGGCDCVNVPARLSIQDGFLRSATLLTPRIYRTNAGTINDELNRHVRVDHDNSLLGSVPDHFADRLLIGDRFVLGSKVYELVKHDRTSIFVEEAMGQPTFTHWRGGLWNMPPLLAERLWSLRCRIATVLLDSPSLAQRFLQSEYKLSAHLITQLITHVDGQQQISEVPDRGLLIEATALPDGEQVCYSFHFPLPAAACEGIARVLSYRLQPSASFPLEPGPLGFIVTLPADCDLSPDRIRSLLCPDNFEQDLQRAMAGSPVLARRFMETAHNGLMLLRQPIRGKVRKVGGSSWGGDKLLHWLRFASRDFPLLRQAQKEACEDYYQIGSALACLDRLQNEETRLRWISQPSPFASEWLPQSTPEPSSPASDLDQLLLTLPPHDEVLHVAS